MSKKDYFISSAKSLQLDIKVDYKSILEEAVNLKNRFIAYKAKPYSHQGWKSICLYGISEKHIDTWGDYGFKTAEEAGNASIWTSISKDCPATVNFLQTQFPCNKFGQVRFELLESNGRVEEHSSSRIPVLENIIIPLTDYKWIWDDGIECNLKAGSAISMNIHYFHSITNTSNIDQYCLVINRHDSTNEWKSIVDKACVDQQVTGEYVLYDIVN